MAGYSDKKTTVQQRLRRIEGQVRGVQRMVDEDAYCIDVLTQISAATKALQAVALELLDEHLAQQLADEWRGLPAAAEQRASEQAENVYAEAVDAARRL